MSELDDVKKEFQEIYKCYTQVQTGKWTDEDEKALEKEMKHIEHQAHIHTIQLIFDVCFALFMLINTLIVIVLLIWKGGL